MSNPSDLSLILALDNVSQQESLLAGMKAVRLAELSRVSHAIAEIANLN